MNCNSKAFPAYGKILTGILYGDPENVLNVLSDIKTSLESKSFDREEVLEKLDDAINEFGGFSKYPKYKDKLSFEKDGVRYGAYTEEGEPCIGGGVGYNDIFTSGDYTVSNASELKEALDKAEKGQTIFIRSDAVIDVSALIEGNNPLLIKEGITLASDRGRCFDDGRLSLGGMICVHSLDWKHMFKVDSDVRITGLRLKGCDPDKHVAHHTRSFYTDKPEPHKYYFTLGAISMSGFVVTGKNLEVDNCEITGFPCAAVSLSANAADAYIHHNYIHHNQGKGLGYGVSHGRGATSVIKYNLFNFNRHDVANSGAPVTGYDASYNINMGECLDHVYDMHGGRDRKDGTNIAGTYCDIHDNTLLSERSPYHVRGVPEEYHRFHHNIVFGKRDLYHYLEGEKYEIYENVFGIDDMEVLK
ncbi:MAG: hypothetical protein E7665_04980 [Ruminococcaceae bacterium]|nr:hypothetical protein [Oscillospiraceae bacterium]